MPSRSTYKLTGAKELEATLRALGEEAATKAGTSGLRKAANIARDELRAAAPYDDQESTGRTYTRNAKGGGRETVHVDYGHLRDNIKVKKRRARKAHTIVTQVTTGNAFWGRFSEFGTEHEPSRPWFAPAMDRVASRVIENITVEIKAAIDRAARRAKK